MRTVRRDQTYSGVRSSPRWCSVTPATSPFREPGSVRRVHRHRTDRDELGGRVVHRLSRRGNRQLNHAIHIAAISLIRFAHSPVRTFYDRKITEGKTKREALRALKRRISDALSVSCSTTPRAWAREGNRTALQSSVTSLEPQQPVLRNNHSRTRPNARTRRPAPATTPRPRASRTTNTRS